MAQNQGLPSSFRKLDGNLGAENLRHEGQQAILDTEHQLPGSNYGNTDQELAASNQCGRETIPEVLYLSNSLINFNHNLGNIRYNHRAMRVRRFTPYQHWTDIPCAQPRGTQTLFYAY